MDFKVEEPGNTVRYFQPPWLAGKKNFWIPDALKGLKQYHFTLVTAFLAISALKPDLLPLFPYFLFATQKNRWGGGGGGHNPWPPSVAGPKYNLLPMTFYDNTDEVLNEMRVIWSSFVRIICEFSDNSL